MLSILIPTYNYVCVQLVADLQRLADHLECPYEILVADDASTDEPCKQANRRVNRLPHCRYIELPENIGRARIRNFLGRQARYGWLLFMDCDAAVASDRFLADYMAACRKAPVIYGGLLHPDHLPSPEVSLAYYYEKHAEPRFTVEKRNRRPYEVFRTFNFMIKKEVFLQYPFDETIVRYGHEDTLFGKTLKEKNIPILHINNPLINCGLDRNIDVLHKTETSLQMLYAHREKLEGTSNILRVHHLLNCIGMVRPVSFLFRRTQQRMQKNLLSSRPNLHIFTLYKIGYYCSVASSGTE